jgi:uncharacterized NAD(P)/FAD-binding protein YdhS
MTRTILIVGAGFSGTVLAANLLRRARSQPTEIILVERGAVMGRGVAYAEREFPFLLNVPAGRLSADSHDPLQFLDFAKSRLGQAHAEDYLPRALYGDYLQDVLLEAERAAPPCVRLTREFGEVIAVQPSAGCSLAAHFADRPPMAADIVVLALGIPSPAQHAWARDVKHHHAFRQSPWDLPNTLTDRHSVLIVGNGLTMADVASSLSRDAQQTPTLHTISRRGLLPQPQSSFRADAMRGNGEVLLAHARSVRRLLRASRAMAREIEKLGGDWREAIAFVRALAPSIWRKMPESERRRFIRHLQAHWDVYRHRLPPQLTQRIEELRRRGKLHIHAGRIHGAAVQNGQLSVAWRPRGSHETRTLAADLIVNATGPDYALERTTNPLLTSLRERGWVSADTLNLGIRTADFGACVDAHGRVSGQLFYLGPMLRAQHWDATAAAELRDHAEQLAAHLSVETPGIRLAQALKARE